MRRSTHIFLQCFLWMLVAPVLAGTAQDFDSSGSVYALGRHGGAPGAAVVSGGPSGNFMRLASGTALNGSQNTLAFDRTDTGAHCTVTVDFDFRISPVAGSAEGFGVSFLHTGVHGQSGAVAVGHEPGLPASVGLGLDVSQDSGELNGNHVSVHFDGSLVAEFDATPAVDLDGTAGQFIHARLRIAADAGSGNVTVRLTPPGGSPIEVVSAVNVPGLRPYEGRVQFAAATGSSAADHDIDNINVTYVGCPDVVGQWGNALAWPVVAIHADMLPNGKVLIWDRDDSNVGPGPPHLYDPQTNMVTPAADPGYDLFCSGHSLLPDGRLFVSGGHDGADFFGLSYGTIYDFSTGAWTTVPHLMNNGRWYPTNTTLSNGDTLVVGGTFAPGQKNLLPQVYELATNRFRDLPDALRSVATYSFFHLAPNGMAFHAGPEVDTSYLDPSGAGAWIPVDTTGSIYRGYGSSAMYDFGKVLILGGGNPPTRDAEVIDLNDSSPQWRFVDPMHFVRRQVNATILPDGTVLATGGTSSAGFNVVDDAVFAAELWDPVQENWSAMSAAAVQRIYHSFALLLPDARVLTGGGGHPPGGGPPGDMDHFDAEIFSPPYLFHGPRPVISSAPTTIEYDNTFLVGSPDAADVIAVNLIRLSAVTHSFNQNQGIAKLAFVNTPQGLEATAPADGIAAQPGHYMLFLINSAGVPSVSSIVQLLPACPDHDGDGYESCIACTPSGLIPCGDCDDTQRTVHPGAAECVNYRDDNCNAQIDEGTSGTYMDGTIWANTCILHNEDAGPPRSTPRRRSPAIRHRR